MDSPMLTVLLSTFLGFICYCSAQAREPVMPPVRDPNFQYVVIMATDPFNPKACDGLKGTVLPNGINNPAFTEINKQVRAFLIQRKYPPAWLTPSAPGSCCALIPQTNAPPACAKIPCDERFFTVCKIPKGSG